MAAGGRPDVLKVFVGNMSPNRNKPKVIDLFSRFDLVPVEVIVPHCHDGKMAVAFVVLSSAPEAQEAIDAVNGFSDPSVTPCAINAHWGVHHGSLYQLLEKLLSVFVSL